MSNNPHIKELEERLKKDLTHFTDSLARTRTGRAHPSLISHLPVECYGSKTPLEQVATIAVEGNSSLLVSPWDQNNADGIESDIRNSDMGLNPARAGSAIRVPIPPLTGERREALIKTLNSEAESARVAIRNHRRDSIGKVKAMGRDGEISEDEAKLLEKQVEALIRKYVDGVDGALAEKTAQISHV